MSHVHFYGAKRTGPAIEKIDGTHTHYLPDGTESTAAYSDDYHAHYINGERLGWPVSVSEQELWRDIRDE